MIEKISQISTVCVKTPSTQGTKGSALGGITNTAGANSGTGKVSEVTTYIKSLVASGQIDPSAGNICLHSFWPRNHQPQRRHRYRRLLHPDCTYYYSANTFKGWAYYGVIPDVSYGACAGVCGSRQLLREQLPSGLARAHGGHHGPGLASNGMDGPEGDIGDYCNDQSAS
ncbi:hypothetical protein BC830DRAFT_1169678 [Chytriomyces sp. MP71]|nr:hypothetical protein BC830DRAFT_1169678 [Chytriomyces sp. MP71]